MKTIFIDSEFKCHTTNPDGIFREIKTDSLSGKCATFFDGKCTAFIEGHRLIPSDESWKNSDGAVINGEMITAWKPYNELDNAQREYERQLLAEYESALAEIEKALGV